MSKAAKVHKPVAAEYSNRLSERPVNGMNWPFDKSCHQAVAGQELSVEHPQKRSASDFLRATESYCKNFISFFTKRAADVSHQLHDSLRERVLSSAQVAPVGSSLGYALSRMTMANFVCLSPIKHPPKQVRNLLPVT